MKHYLDFQGMAVLAHRGGALEANENTLENLNNVSLANITVK